MINLNSEHQEKETYLDEDEFWLDNYVPMSCNYCGRMRVEITNKGKKVCEKCNMNQDTGEFERSYI